MGACAPRHGMMTPLDPICTRYSKRGQWRAAHEHVPYSRETPNVRTPEARPRGPDVSHPVVTSTRRASLETPNTRTSHGPALRTSAIGRIFLPIFLLIPVLSSSASNLFLLHEGCLVFSAISTLLDKQYDTMLKWVQVTVSGRQICM